MSDWEADWADNERDRVAEEAIEIDEQPDPRDSENEGDWA